MIPRAKGDLNEGFSVILVLAQQLHYGTQGSRSGFSLSVSRSLEHRRRPRYRSHFGECGTWSGPSASSSNIPASVIRADVATTWVADLLLIPRSKFMGSTPRLDFVPQISGARLDLATVTATVTATVNSHGAPGQSVSMATEVGLSLPRPIAARPLLSFH